MHAGQDQDPIICFHNVKDSSNAIMLGIAEIIALLAASKVDSTVPHCRVLLGKEEVSGQAEQQQQAYACQSQALSGAQLAGCAITQLDFEAAVKKVQPSVRREGFATTPDVTWSDVGSLAEVPLPLCHIVQQACIQLSYQCACVVPHCLSLCRVACVLCRPLCLFPHQSHAQSHSLPGVKCDDGFRCERSSALPSLSQLRILSSMQPWGWGPPQGCSCMARQVVARPWLPRPLLMSLESTSSPSRCALLRPPRHLLEYALQGFIHQSSRGSLAH